jgi:RIO-like serine/threonine protein kinase
MTLLDERAAQVEPADLLIMAMVESVHAAKKQCVPASIHVLIGGLPVDEAARRLHRLAQLGLLEEEMAGVGLYWVSPMGAELLDREMPGWAPSEAEQERRDSQLRSAVAGALRH